MPQDIDVNTRTDLEDKACGKALELLALVPEDSARMELLRQLQPICEILSAVGELRAEFFFREEIQSRFNLTNAECSSYLREIARLRKARENHSEEEHFEYSADFENLIDLVECDGECAFLIKEQGSIVVRKEVRVNGARLIPPPKQQIPWLLPRASEVLTYFEQYRTNTARAVDSKLYDDLISYYQKCSQLPSIEAYHALTAWTFHSYLLEMARHSPFICFCGPPEKGKTRSGKAMVYVAYRGVQVESLSGAQLIRLARDLRASIFFDVADFVKKANQQRIGDCILLRCERGASIFKVSRPWLGAHHDMELYDVFGATIIGSNQNLDDLYETRSLILHMLSATKSFERDVTPEMALSLKERLVCFRGFHYGQPLPKLVKPVEGRLGDMTRPLMQMIYLVKPEAGPILRDFIQEQESERKLKKGDSLDAQLIRAVCQSAPEVQHGRLLIQTICTALNGDKSVLSKRDPTWVGRRLSALGVAKTRIGPNGSTAILWDEEQIEKLCTEFGLPSVLSDPSNPIAHALDPVEYLKEYEARLKQLDD